jgi:rRNA-processing protein FCF1
MADKEYSSLITRFDTLKKAVIDTSSIIYMNKAGFFEIVSRTLNLITIPEVFDELDRRDSKEPWLKDVSAAVNCRDLPASRYPAPEATDDKLLSLTQETGLPLVSEDGKLLMKCDRAGIPYYNSLMILLFLFYRKSIDEVEYDRVKRRLLTHARYSKRVLAFEREVFMEVLKYR